jgi:hypothetical protein
VSKGARELQDLVNLVGKTPNWTVKELKTVWHVHPPLSTEHYAIPKKPVVQPHYLRNIGHDLKSLGWTEESAKAAIKAAGQEKTRAVRGKADRQTAELAAHMGDEGEEQTALPLYEADIVGDASHIPPGPLGTDDIYSIDNVLLTPELAEKFLDTNIENNRAASKQNYGDIAKDILAGRWKRNGDRIRFARVKDARGNWVHRLIDGQKRCEAVMECGIAIPVDLIYNLDRDAFPTIDIQQSRSGHQVLYMRGVANPLMISAGIKVVWMYDTRPDEHWSVRVTNPHLSELYDADPAGWQSAAKFVQGVLKSASSGDRGMFAQRTLLGSYYVCRRAYPANPKLDEFFETVVLGVELPRDTTDPRFKLRRIFSNERDIGIRKNGKRHLAMLLKAYNSFMVNDRLGKVSWDEPESMPVPVMGG